MGPIVTAEKSVWFRVAFGLLLLFLFFLPLYEAPKNIFSVLFFLLGGWIVIRHQHAVGFFLKMDLAPRVFLLLAISPFFSGIGSPYMGFGERFLSALNWSLMPLVALVLMLFDVSRNQLLWALRVLCVGTVLAVIHGFSQWKSGYPELNSVGHVNQSALYLAFTLVPVGLLFVNRQRYWDSLLALAGLIAVFWYLGPSRSLVGFGAALIVVVGFWLIISVERGWFRIFLGSMCVAVTLVPVVVKAPAEYFSLYQGFKEEFDQRVAFKGDLYSQRDRLINSSIEIAGGSFTGFGLGSFGEAASWENIKAAVIKRKADWNKERLKYFSSSHGHNIFANLLVERGLLGVGSIALCLLVILGVFLRSIRQIGSQVGVLTILVILIGGLGQSTLHVEHGQLAFICLALCWKLSVMDT